jgi:hypothetical protein
VVEEADTYLDAVEGERKVDVCSVPTFRVFFTCSGLSGGPMFAVFGFVTGFVGCLLGDGRASDSLPVSLAPMDLSGKVFFDGELISERAESPIAMLCREDGCFNLDGLTLSSEARTGEREDVADIRDVEDGRRNFDTGCVYGSLAFVAPDDALDGDLETLDTLDGAREGDRIGLVPLKKLDCLFTEAGDGGICANVSNVRSDKDGRTPRRPRTSCVDAMDAVSSSPTTELNSSEICVSSSPPWISFRFWAKTGSS